MSDRRPNVGKVSYASGQPCLFLISLDVLYLWCVKDDKLTSKIRIHHIIVTTSGVRSFSAHTIRGWIVNHKFEWVPKSSVCLILIRWRSNGRSVGNVR